MGKTKVAFLLFTGFVALTALSLALVITGGVRGMISGDSRGGAAGAGGKGSAMPVEQPASEAPILDVAGVELPVGVTPRMVGQGRQIFMGRKGSGTCWVCHGMNARGGPLAPDQTDDRWLHGDGSYEFIVRTTKTGIGSPKEAVAPMPPYGGAVPPLSDEDVAAVAAYVWALSRVR